MAYQTSLDLLSILLRRALECVVRTGGANVQRVVHATNWTDRRLRWDGTHTQSRSYDKDDEGDDNDGSQSSSSDLRCPR